ncbi:MAG: hypothetical protein ACFFAT_08815 [Promethearchaeota archaeon]
MKKIKGTLLKPWVIAIRANRSGGYDDFITEEDKKIVNQRILDAAWYPYGTFKNCYNAVCKIEAKENIKVIEKWGYDYGKSVLERVYKEPMRKKELEAAISSYNNLFKLWFNFGYQHGEIISNDEVDIFIEDFDKDFKLFYHIAKGWMHGFFEAYLDTKVMTRFIEKSWEDADKTVVKITWNT